MDRDRFLRWIGAIVGAVVGAALGFLLGDEEGRLSQALAWAAVGIPAGALLGMVLVYALAALVVLVGIPLSLAGLGLYALVLAVADRFRREPYRRDPES